MTIRCLPLQGSTVKVTATQDGKTAATIIDIQGLNPFSDMTDWTWTITVVKTGFAAMKQEVTIASNTTTRAFEMKLLTLVHGVSTEHDSGCDCKHVWCGGR